MKKILLLLIINFLFIGNVYANETEEQLEELKYNISNIETKVTNIEKTRLNKMYPIGSIYITTIYSSTSQVENAVGGTWEEYGSGKTLVNVDENDSSFNEVNKTGGNSKTILSNSNLPSHSHEISSLTGTAELSGAHTHVIPSLTGTTNRTGIHNHGFNRNVMSWPVNNPSISDTWPNWGQYTTAKVRQITETNYAGDHSHTVTTEESQTENAGEHTHDVTIPENETETVGETTPFTNLQPYITVYMYKRVA